MNGRLYKDRGARTDRAICSIAAGKGYRGERIFRMYKRGSDLHMPSLGVDCAVEVKRLATGFTQLYDWLNGHDTLIVKADRQEPLVILRMSLAAEIAKRAV
jgi:hypothetical protein